MDFDAEGLELDEHCPQCDSTDTVTYTYTEGFSELECRRCGYTSEAPDIADLARFRGELKEENPTILPFPVKKLEA